MRRLTWPTFSGAASFRRPATALPLHFDGNYDIASPIEAQGGNAPRRARLPHAEFALEWQDAPRLRRPARRRVNAHS